MIEQEKKGLTRWVRKYLEEHDTGYPKGIHAAYTEWCEEHGFEPPQYSSVRRQIWLLKDLGLIEESHTEPGQNPALNPRQYYRLTPRGRDPSAWPDDAVEAKYGR